MGLWVVGTGYRRGGRSWGLLAEVVDRSNDPPPPAIPLSLYPLPPPSLQTMMIMIDM